MEQDLVQEDTDLVQDIVPLDAEPEPELDLFNKKFEGSLYNKMPVAFKHAIDHVPPNFMIIDEHKLEKKLKPSPTLNMLRFRLWDEYNKASDSGKLKLSVQDLCRGICAPSFLLHNIFRSTLATAWLIRPPLKYEQLAQEALFTGVRQIRKILNMPLYDEDGKPDVKVARLQLDVVKLLDNRLQGAPIQKIQQVNVNTEATMKEMKEIMATDSMQALETKLGKLRRELGDDAKYLETPTKPESAHDVEIDLGEAEGKRF